MIFVIYRNKRFLGGHEKKISKYLDTSSTAFPMDFFSAALPSIWLQAEYNTNSVSFTDENFGCILFAGSTKCSISAIVNSLTRIKPDLGEISFLNACPEKSNLFHRYKTDFQMNRIFTLEVIYLSEQQQKEGFLH